MATRRSECATLGFPLRSDPAPAFADVVPGPLRLLLSGQVLIADPAGNLIELFEPAAR